MRRFKGTMTGILLVSLLSFISCSRNSFPEQQLKKFSGKTILEWNETAYMAFDGPLYQHSLMASRINAMVHLAMHDALNAIEPHYATYAFKGRDPLAEPITAAATAAYEVLLHEIPAKKTFLDSALEKSIAPIADGDAKEWGKTIGKRAAQVIINSRSGDGSAGSPIGTIVPSDIPGVYQAVPPFDFIFAPQWENVKLFGLQTKNQFRPAAPPALNSEAYTQGYNEVKSAGKNNSTTRTALHTAYAKFWYEFSEAGWNRVARVIAENKQMDLIETARLFALVDMALADAYTAGWDAKFAYNFWRPFTAIRKGEQDHNPNTNADLSWEPAEPTPPVQDYPSTHSALGNAAATVMVRLVGNNTAFSMSSPTALPAGSTRSFNSLYEAADENADSRVRAGIHFKFSCVAGQQLGNQIGNWIVDKHLRALN